MIEMAIYFGVILIVVTDVFVAQKLMAKRKLLDLTKPEDAKRDKSLRMVVQGMLVYSFALAAFMILYIKPMLLDE
jgi:hypothetical protein